MVESDNSLAPETKPVIKFDKKRHPFLQYVYKTFMQLFLIIIIGGSSIFLFSTIAGWSCKTEISVKIFAEFSNYVWIGASGVFPFIYVIITGKLKEGVLWGWFLSWSIMFVISAIIPAMLIAQKPELKHTILNSFPEAIAVTPMFVFGWFPVLIVCGIAYGIHCLIKKKRTPDTTKSNIETPESANPF